MISGSSREIYFICRHHAELKVKLIHAEGRIISILRLYLENNIDDSWNVGGDRELSDAWTGFTRFTVLKKKPSEGYTWSGERD